MTAPAVVEPVAQSEQVTIVDVARGDPGRLPMPSEGPAASTRRTGQGPVQVRLNGHPEGAPRTRALQQEAWAGLEAHLVGKAGIPYDRIHVTTSSARGVGGVEALHDVAVVNPRTSPTNIGLHLAALAAQVLRADLPLAVAGAKVAGVLTTLLHLDKDPHGFLYNWYDADTGARTPVSGAARGADGGVVHVQDGHFVSSVDNGNLMVALDGVRHVFRDDATIVAAIDELLAPMKAAFRAAFLDEGPPHRGVLTLGFYEKDGATYPTVEHYDRLGSEARATVAVLEAEAVLPPGSLARMAERPAVALVHVAGGRDVKVMQTWDGGVFQWLLPQVLLGETEISDVMQASHKHLLLALNALGRYGLPAAYSASDVPEAGGGHRYEGKSGVPELAEDGPWVKGGVISPHAIFLLASVDEATAERALERLLAVAPQLQRPGIGLCDGIDLDTGRTTDTLLSLNQLMTVLAGSGFDVAVRARIDELATTTAGGRSLAAIYAGLPLDVM